jgi:hypothetical protein
VAFAGLRGAVECMSDDPAVVQVPSAAVDREAAGLVVYVQRDGAPVPVPVTLLISSGASALVRARDGEGLRAGTRVAEDARALVRMQTQEGAL